MLQAVPENLELIQALNGSTPFSYATVDPLEVVLADNYFLSVRGNLRRGDTVRVFRDGDHHMQIWDLIVVEAGQRRVRVDLIGTVYDSSRPAASHPRQQILDGRTAPDGCSVKRIFGGFAVLDGAGLEVCRVSTKAKAEAVARGQAPVPHQRKTSQKQEANQS
jgi:hypothetical protein